MNVTPSRSPRYWKRRATPPKPRSACARSRRTATPSSSATAVAPAALVDALTAGRHRDSPSRAPPARPSVNRSTSRVDDLVDDAVVRVRGRSRRCARAGRSCREARGDRRRRRSTPPGRAPTSTNCSKARDERVEVAVVVEMVGFDVRDDRGLRRRAAGTFRRSRRPRRPATRPHRTRRWLPTSLTSPPITKLG